MAGYIANFRLIYTNKIQRPKNGWRDLAPERVDVEKRLIQFWNPLLMALLIGTFAPPIGNICGGGKPSKLEGSSCICRVFLALNLNLIYFSAKWQQSLIKIFVQRENLKNNLDQFNRSVL